MFCLESLLRVSNLSVKSSLNCLEFVKTRHMPSFTYSTIHLSVSVDYTWRQRMIYFLITVIELNTLLDTQSRWLF